VLSRSLSSVAAIGVALALPSARRAKLDKSTVLLFIQWRKDVEAAPLSVPISMGNNRLL